MSGPRRLRSPARPAGAGAASRGTAHATADATRPGLTAVCHAGAPARSAEKTILRPDRWKAARRRRPGDPAPTFRNSARCKPDAVAAGVAPPVVLGPDPQGENEIRVHPQRVFTAPVRPHAEDPSVLGEKQDGAVRPRAPDLVGHPQSREILDELLESHCADVPGDSAPTYPGLPRRGTSPSGSFALPSRSSSRNAGPRRCLQARTGGTCEARPPRGLPGSSRRAAVRCPISSIPSRRRGDGGIPGVRRCRRAPRPRSVPLPPQRSSARDSGRGIAPRAGAHRPGSGRRPRSGSRARTRGRNQSS